MGTTRKRKLPIDDPAKLANARILAAREQRIIDQEIANTLDLGLKIEQKQPETAAELLRDEWDKKAFGDVPKLTTHVVYGPDPLVDNCPAFHDYLEKHGKEGLALLFQELILRKGEMAAPDAVMRVGIRKSIARFGKEATAKAFYDRVMQIPERTVEIEIDTELDPLLMNPMRAIVAQYCPAGMAPKFLSDRCMQVLGKRGYEIVKDERGDPVRCGTLYLGVIPQHVAERRRQYFADQSRAEVKEQEEAYLERADRFAREEGGGAAPLTARDSVTANPRINDDYTGESRRAGFDVTTI